MGHRKQRLESEIIKEASKIILYELKDPRLGFVTITRAKVSDDYHYAKISVSVMGDQKQKNLTMQALDHALGFVQRELGKRLKIRTFPEIRFELDDSIEKTFKVLNTLEELAKDRRKRGVEPEEQES